ncbi:MAG: 2-hydroxyacid dehydrogenase [Haloferacaceae archaeon]
MSDDSVVYVTREIPEAGLELLESEAGVHVWDGKLPPDKDHIIRRLEELEADGLLCLLTDDIDGTVMDASPSLDVVSTVSVGYDHIDMDAAAERDIAVGHTPGVLSETTADFTWALLLTTARRTIEAHEYVRADEWETWEPTLLTGPDVHHATLGVIGLGKIGSAVARRAAGFEMTVLYSNPDRAEETEAELEAAGVDITYVEENELLERSDFVSLHTPLTEETYHLVGEEELRLMGEDTVLINTSRGPVVDTEALDTALENGWILRAGLDVTDPEPLPADHPIMRHTPERLVVAPHIGSASIETRNEMARMAAENLIAGLAGRELPNSAHADRE